MKAQLRRALPRNPTEHGFGTELWMLKRAVMHIKRMYDVEYSQAQIWRLLATLSFSARKIEPRAIERDEPLDGYIHMTFLLPYCPELNPVEYLWAWLKRHAIANFCPDNLKS